MSPNFRNNRPLKECVAILPICSICGDGLKALHKLFKLRVCGNFCRETQRALPAQAGKHEDVFDTWSAGGPQCISHQSHLIPCVSMCPFCRQQRFKIKVVKINKKEAK